MHRSLLSVCLLLAAPAAVRADPSLGLFDGHGDVGTVSRPGQVVFTPQDGTYRVSAAGANMWFREDDMQFVWKRVGGDTAIAADIAFAGDSPQGHRKACLMIRQNTDPGSAYVDVACHGDGLTSLQYRAAANGPTREIQSEVSRPSRVRLDKIGDAVYLSVAGADGQLRPSGAWIKVAFKDPFFIGLAVCAHDAAAYETATFARVEIGRPDPKAAEPQPHKQIVTLPTGDQRVAPKP